jgi:hypothetical protein
MGGFGSGGKRPGAGRKKKTDLEKEIGGNAGRRVPAMIVAHPSSPKAELSTPAPTAVAPVERVPPPKDLTEDERKVWDALAPHALAKRTLTKATAWAFRMLCRNIVLENRYANSVNDQGSANHRGMIQRIDAELARFSLAPSGRPMYEAPTKDGSPEKAPNPINRFLTRK